jgi:NADPH:quinone reductase-like Zn-dependent oxidoreductase
VPGGISLEVAATLPESGVLALQGLRGGEAIRPGSRVLVNGAAGNVGPFVVQLAKAFGAEVTAVATGAGLDLVRTLGADHVIDFMREDYARRPERYDWIVDMWATRSVLASRRALRPGGRYVMIGGPTGRILEALVVGGVASAAGSRKAGLLIWWKPFDPAVVATLLRLVEEGRLRPAIGARHPLEGVPDALRAVQTGAAVGKQLIEVVPG